MLDKLRVEFTKSRPRHSNDNGLAETKNGAIVRKHLGYSHIPQRFARVVNAFCRITSYNVCYTKLLRARRRAQFHAVLAEGERGVARCSLARGNLGTGRVRGRLLVITSYSIHYTKLYELTL